MPSDFGAHWSAGCLVLTGLTFVCAAVMTLYIYPLLAGAVAATIAVCVVLPYVIGRGAHEVMRLVE